LYKTLISITVPAFGDKENLSYCGILRRGAQVLGAGQPFETVYDIDFSSAVNAEGSPNRLKIPNFDSNGKILNYTIIKREVVVNGVTKVFKKVVTPNDVRPFYELFLPEKNVLGITSVLIKEGTQYVTIPPTQEFLGQSNRWYEVQALMEDRVFIEDPTKTSDSPGIKVGKYVTTTDKFITEYTPEGFFKMTFGGGNTSAEDQLREFARDGLSFDLSKYTNNLTLGSALKPNTTMFIQYRVGGGSNTNLGINVISQIGTVNFAVNGPSDNVNRSVINSLRCNNVTAAIGGADNPSTEEVRQMVSFNFDYISVESANVIDLSTNVDVVLDASQNQGTIVTQIIDIITQYFSPSNRQMGENVYISEIRKRIQNLDGVISISDVQFFNKVGGQYSSSQTSQRYVDPATRQIELIADTIFAEPTQMYQIRFPNKDINVRVLNFKGINFS